MPNLRQFQSRRPGGRVLRALIWGAVLWAGSVFGPAQAADRPLVLAAASLSEALTEALAAVAPAPRLSFGGSGAMARQVAQGAPADLLLLASPDWMDWLARQGLLPYGAQAAPFGNALALVGPPGAAPFSALSAEALMARLGPSGRLAMGEHRAVPAGQYAAKWLKSKGLWDTLRPRLAETENVRAALALVTRGEVPLAILYRSDLVAAPGAVREVWTIPEAEQPPIRYAMAALTPAGQTLIAHLTTPDAQAIFARFGFAPVTAP